VEIFRITATIWASKLIASGRAARWNSKGVDMLYFAQSAALACLENAVHRSTIDLQNINFSLITVQAPSDFKVINESDLPIGWNELTPFAFDLCRPVGDSWILSNSSLLLRVPSKIIPGEYNFLVNPKHSDFDKLKIVDISPFAFDSRIK